MLASFGCVDANGVLLPINTSNDQRPVAFARFDPGRLTAGSTATLVGFLPDGFIEPWATNDGSSTGFRFTYQIDFRVVMANARGRQIVGDGIRRIYFHPNGA